MRYETNKCVYKKSILKIIYEAHASSRKAPEKVAMKMKERKKKKRRPLQKNFVDRKNFIRPYQRNG